MQLPSRGPIHPDAIEVTVTITVNARSAVQLTGVTAFLDLSGFPVGGHIPVEDSGQAGPPPGRVLSGLHSPC